MIKARILFALITLSKKRSFRIIVVSIILLPIILGMLSILLITAIFSSFAGAMHDDSGTLHSDAILEIKLEKSISNDLSSYLLRSIDLIDDGEYIAEMGDLKTYIKDYFVSETEEIFTGEDGYEYEITKYEFKEKSEILEFISEKPFSFTEEEIECILLFETIEGSFIGKFPMPCDGVLTSTYGKRIHPITGKITFHKGIDIAPYHHAPIQTIADGIVHNVSTREGNTYGNNVTIKHDLGTEIIFTFYAHLSEVHVYAGQTVSQGQTIGLEGGEPGVDPNVGVSTGHHLHFEVRTSPSSADHIDPRRYLSN